MKQLLYVAWIKIRTDLAEQTRYPLQFVIGLLTTGAMLWGLGIAAARTSGESTGTGALATFIAMGAVSLFYLIPRVLAGGKDHPPEEAMLYPYPLARLVSTLATVSAVQIGTGLAGIYLLASLVVTRGTPGAGYVLAAMALALLSVAGAGMLVFALKLIFRRVDSVAMLVQLAFFALAFAPTLDRSWVAAVPLAGAIRWLRQPDLPAWPVVAFALIWLAAGYIAVARAERAVVDRGVAAYG